MVKDGQLLVLARQARQEAYAPYSNFSVGAAVLCEDGSVYTGCNIENASYSLSVCAERVAVYKAVSEGHRTLLAVAVAGGSVGMPPQDCMPCGSCLQVLHQFGGERMRVVTEQGTYTLAQLLPYAFRI